MSAPLPPGRQVRDGDGWEQLLQGYESLEPIPDGGAVGFRVVVVVVVVVVGGGGGGGEGFTVVVGYRVELPGFSQRCVT